ncbi:MAG: LysM peptidoglycan-binding domain-containing protein [Solirubrobacterales bacterium]|nr:LysM peptidoglycan-binding domain-containing protein [Solirubrobacterales bacterium]
MAEFGSTVQLAGATQSRGRFLRYLAPVALVALLAATAIVVVMSPGISGNHGSQANLPRHALRRPPPYWIVRPGDTLALIARKTGLTVVQLEAFNRNTDPNALLPGQRLNLWAHPPMPRPKPAGPRFWTVRPGDSLGLIADKTGINLSKLEQLNPKLASSTLQPGDRVRLRP